MLREYAVSALSWLQQPHRRLDDADYATINRTLNEMPPNYAGYQAILTAYQVLTRALRPPPDQLQPLKLAYHHSRLHYILPEFVAGQASRNLVVRLCDMDEEQDAAVTEHDEAD